MDYYDKHFQENNRSDTGEYSRDGAVDLAAWNNARPKILYLLKQTAGYGNPDDPKSSKRLGWNISEELARANGWLAPSKGRRRDAITYKKIAKLSWSLQVALDRGMALTRAEIDGLGSEQKDLFSAISSSSIVNISKHSGQSTTGRGYILNQGKKNASIIRRQIDELAPQVIVVGSDVVWDCLDNRDWGIFKDIITSSVKQRHECARFGDILFYHANHPSAWTGGGFDVAKIHSQIFRAIKNSQNATGATGSGLDR